jgi:hypothetical protein
MVMGMAKFAPAPHKLKGGLTPHFHQTSFARLTWRGVLGASFTVAEQPVRPTPRRGAPPYVKPDFGRQRPAFLLIEQDYRGDLAKRTYAQKSESDGIIGGYGDFGSRRIDAVLQPAQWPKGDFSA